MTIARFFRVTLAGLLIALANEHKVARAELLAKEVPADELAPELSDLPAQTQDGRTIPESRALQFENALHKLAARGELPEHPDLSLSKLKEVGRAIANFPGGVCFMSLDTLDHEKDLRQSQFRLACQWFEAAGFLFNFPRVSADDRKIGGARRPMTDTRTTVRKIFPIPRHLVGKLSEDEILDLIAFGDRTPVAELAGQASPVAPPPAPAPRPRRVQELPAATRALVAPPSAPAPSPELAPLAAALDQLEGVLGHALDASWVAAEGRRVGLTDLDLVVAAVHDVVEFRRREPRSYELQHARSIVLRALRDKKTWVDRGGPAAKASAEARGREAAHAAAKSPEERRRAAPETRAAHRPQTDAIELPVELRRMQQAVIFEEDPVKRAALQAKYEAALAEHRSRAAPS